MNVAGLWRYPVKSMAGEALTEAALSAAGGIAGDREWAVRDESRGEITDARTFPALLNLRARYLADDLSAVEITLPDGAPVRSGGPAAGKALSELLGTEVTLWRRPDDDRHYRRARVQGDDLMAMALETFQLDDIDDVIKVAGEFLPPELMTYHTMPGAYFDVGPLHLITDRSLATLRRLAPGSDPVVQRFRPNLLIQAGTDTDTDLPELDWVGRRIRLGTATLRVTVPTVRCVMTTMPLGDLPKDRDILRTIHRSLDHCLGVYAEVEEPGVVRMGDVVRM